ncbi:MAG: SpoIID/LytB domain-containing protein [Clostridia bacterium]|nr:SpoIID/LytB domain-containing protein [Clostridia bacterium]
MSGSKKDKKAGAAAIAVRIVAIFLAFLMIAGVAVIALEFIIGSRAVAAELSPTESAAFASSASDREFYVAVALRWGTSVTVSHEITSQYGFAFGESLISKTERAFTPVWTTDENDVIVAEDCNLSVGYKSCSVAANENDTDVGAYHVELRLSDAPEPAAPAGTGDEPAGPSLTEETEAGPGNGQNPENSSDAVTADTPETDPEESLTQPAETPVTGAAEESSDLTAEPGEPVITGIWDLLPDIRDLYGITYEQVFPALISGEKVIRIGAFADYASATAAAAAIGSELDGFEVSVASPSFNGITVLNEDYDTILFKYAGEENRCGAVCALQGPGTDRSYLCYVANGYLYDGAFCFRRYVKDDTDGLILINLVGLLEYCEGVVAGEIYVSWPVESLKAFAITVNSFTTRNLNRRFNTYGCDLLASSVDQNYTGRNNVNRNVIDACTDVYGKILVYTDPSTGKSQIVDAAYSSSQGGCSVNSTYVWGGYSGPFIISQPTPWENYTEVSRGQWFFEVSPKDLATRVKAYNSSLISGTSITSVEYETTGDSSYVYSISLTDNKGKTATVTKCSNVNSLMGQYSYSANFVIGKNQVEYTYEKVLSCEVIDLNSNYSGNLTVETSDGRYVSTSSVFSFFSEFGLFPKDESRSLYVRTAEGTALLSGEGDIPMTTLPDEQGIYTDVADYGSFLIVTRLQQFTKTYRAQTSGNFVIAGRGFGHGVGMSQYGICHLARAGAAYRHILYAYYPGTDIGDFFEWNG